MADIKIITDVTKEPITMREAKEHCRLSADFADDDVYVASLTRLARQTCENYTRLVLAPKTLEMILNDFPLVDYIEFNPPVTSITSVKYKDSSGTEITWASSNYILNCDIFIPRLVLAYGCNWPTFTPYPTGAVRIRYVSGYVSDVPEGIKQAMLLLIAHWYETRIPTETGNAIEQTVNYLLRPYKIYNL